MSFVRVSAHACSVREMLMIYRICGGEGGREKPREVEKETKNEKSEITGRHKDTMPG